MLGRKSAGFYSDAMLSLSCPGLGRFWAHGLCGWLIRKGPGWDGALRTKKFKSSEKQ
jgi:hypothetical protein